MRLFLLLDTLVIDVITEIDGKGGWDPTADGKGGWDYALPNDGKAGW